MASIVPLPAVNGLIFNEEREILLTRRSPKIREAGKWCLPGGHLEGGEDWATAVKREVQEETGLTAKAIKLLGVYSDPSLTVTAEVLPAGYYGQFVVVAFLILEYEGHVSPNDEVDEWGWFSVEKLPTPMLKSHPVRIQDGYRFQGEAFVR